MGEAGKQEQVLSCFQIVRKFLAGCRKILFFAMDIALFNMLIICFILIKEKLEKEYTAFCLELHGRFLRM
jgi:hypothetical protein